MPTDRALECSMDVTNRLLRVYQLDRQLAGLKSRLLAAERFLAEQTRQLQAIETKRNALIVQSKQIAAAVANQELDIKGTDERIEHLREQMNQARTNKEYKAFLTEINLLKADKGKVEEEALGQMTKSDEIKAQLGKLDEAHGERVRMRGVAQADCDARRAEIADRLNELEAERGKAAAEVPGDVLAQYERLHELRDEDAMAPVEITDRKRHEYNCGACMMSLPMEVSISLLAGKLTVCSNCQCILYLPPEAAQALTPSKR
jgi:predicted  nucleic acid-binding Zn-ribbon protein